MLIKCPECELQVSDKATFCPHQSPTALNRRSGKEKPGTLSYQAQPVNNGPDG